LYISKKYRLINRVLDVCWCQIWCKSVQRRRRNVGGRWRRRNIMQNDDQQLVLPKFWTIAVLQKR